MLEKREIIEVSQPVPISPDPEPEIEEDDMATEENTKINESFEGDTEQRSWDANVKRLFDEMLARSLIQLDHNQTVFDQLNAVQVQHIQNAVAQSEALAAASIDRVRALDAAHGDHVRNMNGINDKDHLQATRHGDIAIENQWESAEEVTQSVVLAGVLTKLAGAGLDDASLGKAVKAITVS